MVQVTFQGKPITLVGKQVQVGDQAPDFILLNSKLEEVSLANYSGKKKLISVVPSLDTGVCSEQTKRFNEEVSKLDNVSVLTVSMDLPFAQARWCGTEAVDRIDVLSDHRQASFGKNYGVLIEELRLLTRSVFVLDEKDVVTYVEYVPEVGSHPDYGAVLAHLKE